MNGGRALPGAAKQAMVRSTRSPNGASGYRAASGAYFLSRTGVPGAAHLPRDQARRAINRSSRAPAADAAVIAGSRQTRAAVTLGVRPQLTEFHFR
jgi:hypothetical protein